MFLKRNELMFLSEMKLPLNTKKRCNNPASSSHVTTNSPLLQRIFSLFRTSPETMETAAISKLWLFFCLFCFVFWSQLCNFCHVDGWSYLPGRSTGEHSGPQQCISCCETCLFKWYFQRMTQILGVSSCLHTKWNHRQHEFTVDFGGKLTTGLYSHFSANYKHEGTSTYNLGKDLICRQLRINDILATLSNN